MTINMSLVETYLWVGLLVMCVWVLVLVALYLLRYCSPSTGTNKELYTEYMRHILPGIYGGLLLILVSGVIDAYNQGARGIALTIFVGIVLAAFVLVLWLGSWAYIFTFGRK